MDDKHYISSIKDFFNIIETIGNNSGPTLYHAHENNNSILVPKLGCVRARNIYDLEQETLSAIRVYGFHCQDKREINDWLLMCMARLQGFPTKLLEWTENASKALWSVCHSDNVQSMTVLKANDNQHVRFVDCPYSLKSTKIFNAASCDTYERDREKWYSIHPLKRSATEYFESLYAEKEYANRLTLIHILPSVKKKLIEELIAMGISYQSEKENTDVHTHLNDAEIMSNKNKGDISSEHDNKNEQRVLEQYGRVYHQDFDFD
ncbi:MULTISPECIES: FRG domain-containing protein [unclassified Vibrio]|uniref:FRG domain-containing protein n=1 Tax=unclassified Vibrio TaxID=2614977 RepID=UPI001268B483|nr:MULTISPECIES: FRG domain-containing protein [unclassified Vibrio]QFT35851.1 hypothetical protein FIU99_05380 [Vibrio sp. THAF64]QGM33751.1 hypothetical protein GGC04_05390 [Vibrio sp. THAF191d]QGN69254.1 hypothetical protein GGC03_05390 [Vibrio sp. THAF191c]